MSYEATSNFDSDPRSSSARSSLLVPRQRACWTAAFAMLLLAACDGVQAPADALPPTADGGPGGGDAGPNGEDAGPRDAGPGGDSTPPTLSLLSPRDGAATGVAQVTVRGQAADETALAGVVWVADEGEQTLEVDSGGRFQVTVRVSPGPNTLRFIARDAAGNEREQGLALYYGHRISVGNSQAAFLRDGELYTWGRNELGQLGNGTLDGSGYGDDPGTSSLPARYAVDVDGLVSVVTRQTFMLALHEDGTVLSWGDNGADQLGYSTPADCGSRGGVPCGRLPSAVPGIEDAIAVAAGFDHALALHADGTVSSWGSNLHGQLGYATTGPTGATPAKVPGLVDVVQLAAGSTSSFALDAMGRVWAWGENDRGQLGGGAADATPHPTPVRITALSDVVQLASANTTVYALTEEGRVMAWGADHAGQSGTGSVSGDDVLVPTPVVVEDGAAMAALEGVVAVTGDGFVGGALTEEGRVYTWGFGRLGQLGQGTLEDGERDLENRFIASPVAVAPADESVFDILELEVGAGGPMLALSRDGHLFGWGWSFRGSLGLEGAIDAWAYSTPTLVFAAE